MIKNIITRTFLFLGRFCSFLYPYAVFRKVGSLKRLFYTGWIAREFFRCGKNVNLYPFSTLEGVRYISIGDNCDLGKRGTLTAWDTYTKDKNNPIIRIGNHVNIGDDYHITSMNRIEIGDNVLAGKRILITDNSHGEFTEELLNTAPEKRPVSSKGPVIIEENVWIGENVCIMPDVRIGRGAIIAANAVVTKNVPPYSIAAGIPAKIIKTL